jgi:hypothetical protein
MLFNRLPVSKVTLVKAEQPATSLLIMGPEKAPSCMAVTIAGIVSDPESGTMLQLSATHVFPLPASVYGEASAHCVQPLVPLMDVPE